MTLVCAANACRRPRWCIVTLLEHVAIAVVELIRPESRPAFDDLRRPAQFRKVRFAEVRCVPPQARRRACRFNFVHVAHRPRVTPCDRASLVPAAVVRAADPEVVVQLVHALGEVAGALRGVRVPNPAEASELRVLGLDRPVRDHVVGRRLPTGKALVKVRVVDPAGVAIRVRCAPQQGHSLPSARLTRWRRPRLTVREPYLPPESIRSLRDERPRLGSRVQ